MTRTPVIKLVVITEVVSITYCINVSSLLGIEIVLHLFVEDVLLQFVASVGKDHSVFVFQNIAQLQALDV